MFDMKLRMELVPSQAHGRKVSSVLSQKTWAKISKRVRDLHDNKCQFCGAPAEHCHEVWEWIVKDGELHQRLVDLESVCSLCHDFKHYGRLIAMKMADRAAYVEKCAMKVNKLTYSELKSYALKCFTAHHYASQIPLGPMDISCLTERSWRETLDLTNEDLAPLCEGRNDEYMKEKHAGEPA